MKTFDIPIIYRSPLIDAIKKQRTGEDKRKKDFRPTILDFGSIQINLARHFGFCYGVQNAIEIAFKTLDEHPDKRIFLLSEMIHNPHVNSNLRERGVQFIMDNHGKQLIPWEELNEEDIVIVPAFGTTLEVEDKLKEIGVQSDQFNTTCPFVKRVWNKASSIGEDIYTIIIHGRPKHEETRATFSHSNSHTPTLIVRNIEEAKTLGAIISGEIPKEDFYKIFEGRYSKNFNVEKDLIRVGVVNQTTMLADETKEISNYIKDIMTAKYDLKEGEILEHFADTRDTLCYATNDNQNAVKGLLEESADLAIVVGGYNSSNTSHLVEMCEDKMPTYFISSRKKMISSKEISHFDLRTKEEKITFDYLPPHNEPLKVAITSGASCPDALVENVIRELLSFYDLEYKMEEKIAQFQD